MNFIALSEFYLKEVRLEEVNKIWEERKKSKNNLPLPKRIEESKIIYSF